MGKNILEWNKICIKVQSSAENTMTWKCTFKVHPGGPNFWPEPNISSHWGCCLLPFAVCVFGCPWNALYGWEWINGQMFGKKTSYLLVVPTKICRKNSSRTFKE
jgi:hypothetical protein